jgi:hypothetical protein
MKRPPENKDREDRFMEEVVVDAYGEEERAMGWYYYAADNMVFPFKAQCSTKRATLLVGFQPQLRGLGEAQPGLWRNLQTADFCAKINEAAVGELPVFCF